MKLTEARKWRRTLAWLRRAFPLQSPATVQSRPLKKVHGDTEFVKSRFYIRIDSSASLDVKLDTIMHEWAHALTWFGAEQAEDHSDEWGLAFQVWSCSKQ